MALHDQSAPSSRHFGDGVSLPELVRFLREGVYIMNAERVVLDGNPVALDLFGVRHPQDPGTPVRDRSRSPSVWQQEMAALVRDGAVREFTREIERPDGSVRTVLDTCYARDDNGTITYHGVVIDVSVVSSRDGSPSADAHTRDQGTGAYTSDYLDVLERQYTAQRDGVIGVCVVHVELGEPVAGVEADKQLDTRLERMTRFLLRHIRASEVVVRATSDQLVVVLPDADERGTETVGRRLQLAALRSAPSAFRLGWASRRPEESMVSVVARALADAVPVRVVERSFQPSRH